MKPPPLVVPRQRVVRACAGLLVAAGLAATVAARQTAEPQPTFRTGAVLVSVDAFVTERGRAVTDLTADDFEIFEDDVRQTIATFEHVQVRGAGAQDERREPDTVASSRDMARDPRARAFVFFLDTYHVEGENARRIRDPLVALLNRVLGPDDLIAVMTPETDARSLTFARRTTTIEGVLDQVWTWGRRDRLTDLDPEDERDLVCYGDGELADALRDRRRERRTLEALTALVDELQTLREGRTAVLTISDGWRLYRPDTRLTRIDRPEDAPGPPPVGVTPDGRLTSSPPPGTFRADRQACETERGRVAQLDNDLYFRQMIETANRANVSFYTVDPRGLAVFDSSIRRPLPPSADAAALGARLDSLRTISEATDGLAIVNTNDLETGLRRMAEDLTSYYLIGYHSTNISNDDTFRTIRTRVTRPGLEVRARRGYRPIVERPEPTGASRAAATPAAITSALGMLGGSAALVPLRVTVSTLPASADSPGRAWLVGDLDAATMKGPEFRKGGEAQVDIVGPNREAVTSARASLAPGARGFRLSVTGLPAGALTARVRVRGLDGGLPLQDVVRFAAEPGAASPPLYGRKQGGPALPFEPTADLRFRRTERLRVEWPVGEREVPRTAQVLDRQAKAMSLQTTVSDRTDADGVRWVAADVTLAPLAAGDYLVRLGESHDWLAAFRIVP